MNNIVMSKMNMDGNGGKVAFRKTAMFPVIAVNVDFEMMKKYYVV